MKTWLVPDAVLMPDARILEGVGILIDDKGRIEAVERPPDAGSGAQVRPVPGALAVPGCVNVHAHLFQSLLRGFASDRDFLKWRDEALYRFSPRLDEDAVYTGALFALSEMLTYGITTVCDFFYLQAGGNDNARAVIRAARDLGIRLVLARALYDWEGAPATYRESAGDAVARTRALHAEVRGDPLVQVHVAPHSAHGASPAMIEAGVRLAEQLDVPLHVHVAEQRFEGDGTREAYGTTPLRHLDRLGAIGPRTIAVHGVWLDDEEIGRLGEAGASLAYCPSSNMFLGDGITRLTDMLRAGVRVGLGTDGGCSNDRLCLYDEMRAAAQLQKVRHLDGGALGARRVFAMGTAEGADILGVRAGRLEAGRHADIVLLERDHPSLLPRTSDVLSHIVYAMSHRAIREVIVAGRTVARDGAPMRVTAHAIAERVKAVTGDWEAAAE